jgi:hypothetical protein
MVGYCGYRSFYMIHPKVDTLYKDFLSDLGVFSDFCTPPAIKLLLAFYNTPSA